KLAAASGLLHHAHRSQASRLRPIPQLTTIVGPPTVDSVGRPIATASVTATGAHRSEGHACRYRYGSGRRCVRECPVAELPVGVIAPAIHSTCAGAPAAVG